MTITYNLALINTTSDDLTATFRAHNTNTKVYGTDNIFVVDASVFPGMVTTNPSALIVNVAEHAAEKILALGGGSKSK